MRVFGSSEMVVATDDHRVAHVIRDFGGRFIMTSQHHASGTDCLAEVMTLIEVVLYINLQGDAPPLCSPVTYVPASPGSFFV
jgi:3-deoxy-manno-octulosonate cytidylyltransferase (CMP-KDO synthetase)